MIGSGGAGNPGIRGRLKHGRRRLAAVAASSVIVAAGACGDGSTAPKGPSANDPAAGRFNLLTVNAKSLPFNFFSGTGYKLDFTAGTLSLLADGKYVMAQTTVETVAGFSSTFLDTLRGSWTQNVGSIMMKGEDGSNAPATWDGRDIQLPLNSDGQLLQTVFRRAP